MNMPSRIVNTPLRRAWLAAARRPIRHAQRGMTLIELMVGIAIGLLVVAVATTALMASRGVSGTVSDASNLQQQAAYAMRMIGGQLRQTGSMYLNLDSGRLDSTTPVSTLVNQPVAFEQAADSGSAAPVGFDLKGAPRALLDGTGNTLTVGFRRYKDPVFTSTATATLARNCVGGPSDSGATAGHQLVQSVFALDSANQLTCSGNGATTQPVIDHVANFQVRYLMQGGTPGNNVMQTVNTVAAANWGQVQGIEVCLVLYGAEAISMPAGSSYTDCDGTTSVDMTTLTGARSNRMHLVFRNVFQLRSQGLM